MSKQLIFILLGLVLAAQVIAANNTPVEPYDEEVDLDTFEEDDDDEFSELSLTPSDDEEVSKLKEANAELFSDYCIKSRNFVSKYLNEEANRAVARAFTILFKSAEDVALDMISVQRLAVDSIGRQIENPESPIDGKEPETQAERIIREEQRNVQENNQGPKSLLGAFLATLRATGSAIVSALMSRLNEQKENVNWVSLFGALSTSCDRILELETQLQEQHNIAKAAIVKEVPAYEVFSFSKTPCVTTKRIYQLQGMCNVVKYSLSPILTVLQTQGLMKDVDVQSTIA